MYDYLRWMVGQEASVLLRHTPETILEGTITVVNETGLVIRNSRDEWAISLDCVMFVKIHGVSEESEVRAC